MAVLTILLATSARLALAPVMGSQFPLLTFFFALVFAAWFGGLGPSLLALGLSLVSIPLVLDPLGTLTIHGLPAQLAFGIYLPLGLAVALMGGSMRAAQLRAEASEAAARKEQRHLEEEIARRRRAEDEKEALIQEQSRLRVLAEQQAAMLSSLLDQVPVGITVFDNDLRFSRINRYNAALCGETPEQLVGRSLRDVLVELHGSEAAAAKEAEFRKVLKTGQPLRIRGSLSELNHRTSEPCFSDWSIRRIESDDGAAVGLLLTAVEVTEHVLQEQALRASEQRFRTMADAAPVLIWVSGTDQRYTYFNRPWLDFTGRTMDQEVGEGWAKGVHPEDLARCLETRATAFGNRQLFNMVYRLRRQDGEYRWVLESGVPWLAADGTFLGYIGSGIDVTEQQRLEEQRNRLLEELEARHAFTEAVIRQVPAGILVADARTGRLFLSNHEAHRIVHGEFEPGHRMEDYDHKIELAGIHDDGSPYQPEDWPLVRVIQHGEVVKDEEIEVVCGDGSRLTISVNAGPVKDQAGEVVAAVAAFHDITDRKQADLAIREREERFRRLADAIPQIVWIARPDNTLLYLNRRWLEYTGLSEEETYRPGSWISVVHPDDLQRVNESALRLLGGGETFEAEYRLRDRHGNYRWFLGRAVRVTDEAGRIVSVFGTATDIDDRRRSEQAARFLADASATLAALVDEASTLQQVARLAVPHFADWCVVDMAGEDGELRRLAVAHVDPAKVALAHDVHRRYPPNPEASTGVSAILHSGKPELVPEVTDEMLVARARDEDHLQIIRKLGLRSYIGVPLPGRDGTLGVISFVASDSGRRYGPDDLRLAQDLACRAAVAVENARLYEKMKEADRRKDEFLATLAHELRNPLAPIRNALQLMARSRGVDHEAERAMAERLVTHLARLVDDLMDVARISRGRIELRKEVVELAPIVARVVQTVGPSASAGRHDLAVSLPEQPVLLDADPTRLEQVLWNLLSNAIKYTEPGGRISLTARRQNGGLALHVCDTGIGIPAEMLPHVFEMFSRAKPLSYHGQGGVGIGLGLVKNLVELHGGTIEAHSDGPGRGSEFLVRLPVLAHASAPVKPDACCGIREQSGTGDDCRRILIVDDNEDAATSLARLLSMLDGHSVQVAHDGPSALALAADFEPEVVILDIGMPGMDGYEVARRFRARPEFQQTRLLALSGWGQEKDRERSRAAGFEHHLVKPVDLELLRGLLS